MHNEQFKPYLTEKDKKRNQYLDQINHAPYFTIFLVIAGIVVLFTMAVLFGLVQSNKIKICLVLELN